ncbi:MAG: hypothetical protein ACOYJ2_06345 [Rickettsiales bacterium]
MSPSRLTLFAALAVACIAWSLPVMYAETVRLNHQSILQEIRDGKTLPKPAALNAAIARYDSAIGRLPCIMPLHEELGLLVALRTDSIMQSQDLNAQADALDAMDRTLTNLLVCTPTNGKAWLDLAMINVYREGFSKRSAQAYVMSGKVSPVESWLAEKRLIFILPFASLLDANGHKTITNDLATLDVAHPNHMSAVMAAAKVDSKAALASMLGQSNPTAAP